MRKKNRPGPDSALPSSLAGRPRHPSSLAVLRKAVPVRPFAGDLGRDRAARDPRLPCANGCRFVRSPGLGKAERGPPVPRSGPPLLDAPAKLFRPGPFHNIAEPLAPSTTLATGGCQMKFTFTTDTLLQLTKLRDQDQLSMQKCAAIIGCSETAVFNALHPKPKQPKPEKPKQQLKPRRPTPPRILHSSCPIHRPINPFYRTLPKPTRRELEARLAIAVRNTARL